MFYRVWTTPAGWMQGKDLFHVQTDILGESGWKDGQAFDCSGSSPSIDWSASRRKRIAGSPWQYANIANILLQSFATRPATGLEAYLTFGGH